MSFVQHISTASPYVVILYPLNSQLQYLVITTTLDFIYSKKNAEKLTDMVSARVLFTLFEGFLRVLSLLPNGFSLR